MKPWTATIALPFLFLVNGTVAHAACNAEINEIDAVPTIDYAPFENRQRQEDFKVEVENKGNEPCRIALAIASAATGAQRLFIGGSSQLGYDILTKDGIPYPNSTTTPLGSRRLDGGTGEEETIKVVVRIPAGLMAPAGTYADTLRFQLFDVSGASPLPLGSERSAPARARIQPRAQLNIAGTSGSFGTFEIGELDFGTLSTGETRNAVVQVRATRPVAITMSARHEGVMKHRTLDGVAGVPYTLNVDGTDVSLAGSGSSLTRTPAQTLDGTNYPLTITIGDTKGRAAGAYRDRITINVMPQ